MAESLTKRKMPVVTKMRFGFTTLFILIFLFTAYEANGFARQARLFPLLVSIAGVLIATISLASDIRRYRREGTSVGDDAPST